MIQVWGRRNSANVQKVLWALEELELPFRRENVGGSFGGNRDADYLAMNPMGLVPVIRDGDVTMFESNAIVRYLSARYRAGVLRPADHRHLAMAEQWMEWQQVNFAPLVSAIFMNTVRTTPEKSNAAAVANAAKQAAAVLPIADRHLSRNEWFAGPDFSFGDVVMGVFYWRFLGLNVSRPATPNLDAWMDTVAKREAFKRGVADVPRARNLEEWSRIERDTA
jgi:glutathione S-transferase